MYNELVNKYYIMSFSSIQELSDITFAYNLISTLSYNEKDTYYNAITFLERVFHNDLHDLNNLKIVEINNLPLAIANQIKEYKAVLLKSHRSVFFMSVNNSNN